MLPVYRIQHIDIKIIILPKPTITESPFCTIPIGERTYAERCYRNNKIVNPVNLVIAQMKTDE